MKTTLSLKVFRNALFISAFIFTLASCTSFSQKSSPQPKFSLERGPKCFECEDYPTNVNLIFEEIKLIQALQLLANFSCNDIRTNFKGDAIISPNYREQPWDIVVKELCETHGLYCWTENEILYVSTVMKGSAKK